MSGPWEEYQPVAAGPWMDYAKPKSDFSIPATQSWINQAIAGIPDALLNTPTNVWNLAKAGVGTVATAAGRPDLAPDLTPNPNYVTRGAEALGLVNPELDPKTAMGRIAKAGVQAGTAGMIAPAQSVGQMGLNMGLGAASNVLGQGTTEVTGSAPLGMAVSIGAVPAASAAIDKMRAASVAAKQQNAQRDATLKEAQDLGYKVPPSAVGGGPVSATMETVGGKAAIGQQMTAENQKVTNAIARQEAQLPANAAITEGNLEKVRERLSWPYDEVRKLAANTPLSQPPFKNPAQTLDELRQVRTDANAYWKEYARNASVDTLKKAQELSGRAQVLENQLEAVAVASGKPGLVQSLREARTAIAKTYDVERALNVATGDVSAPILGRMLDKGAPLSGGLETIGKFHQAFEHYAREGVKTPPPGLSKLDFYAAIGAAGGGHAMFGEPGLLAAGIPLASGVSRAALMTGPGQAMMSTPRYFPSMLPQLSDPYLRGILASQQQQ